MKNADMPAMPCEFTLGTTHEMFIGLTKREEFVKAAMHGLLANPTMIDGATRAQCEWLALASIEMADIQLTALDKAK